MAIICQSFNGWPVSHDPRELDLVSFEVPAVPGRKWTTVRCARPLFAYLIRRFHAEVEPVNVGRLDDWSWNVRPARTQDKTDPPRSNHGSGTAIDIDATEYPRGTVHMSAAQVAKVHEILRDLGGLIAWGGDFVQAKNKDQMHFELRPGSTKAQVLGQVAKMRLDEDGVKKPLPVPPPAPSGGGGHGSTGVPVPPVKPAPKPVPVPTPHPAAHPTVRLGVLHTGVRGEEIRTYQRYLRPFAARLGLNVAAINPSGATGFYGKETAALTRAVYKALAVKGGAAWLRGDLTIPGKALLEKLGLQVKG